MAAAAVPLVEGAASTSPNRTVSVSKHLPSFLLSIYFPYSFPLLQLSLLSPSFLSPRPRGYNCPPSLSFPFSFLFSLYDHHFHHHYHHHYHHHHHHNGSFRPLLNSLGVGDDDGSPRACSVRTFVVLSYFRGCLVDKESLQVIIC
jgi:hypothetical protein